jgi:hypothetical protein
MSLAIGAIEPLTGVRSEMNYLARTAGRPRTYTFDPPPGIPRTTVVNEPHIVLISDARPVLRNVSLDEEGFGLVHHESTVRDFHSEQEVTSVYYPEAENILKQATGADRVFIFDHTVRRRIPGSEDRRAEAPRQPVPRVHVDHTEKSGPQRVRDLLPDEAAELLRGRVQIINIWRPIRGPLLDAPLAVCDASSVKPEQLIPSDLVYTNRMGETYSVIFDPEHRWFYVPRMRTNEALLLKCYDSKTDGRARFAPHSAFTDPTTPPDAPPRESIEIRALVFHQA